MGPKPGKQVMAAAAEEFWHGAELTLAAPWKKLAAMHRSLSFLLPMNWSEQVAVVIPCLNEGKSILRLVREARNYLAVVYVIDDGSTDNTAAAAQAAGAEVISHPAPRGKGAALRTGLSCALADGHAWALALDGDGQHAPSDIPAFLSHAERVSVAMLVGNRMHQSAAMPPVRRFVNRWMSRRLGKLCQTSLPDSQCGFRMLDLRAWSELRFSSDHFEIESELIVRFLMAGLTVDFVPIQTRYGLERSKIQPLRDTIRWLKWWRAIRSEMAAKGRSTEGKAPIRSTPQDATA
jgi:glycosyltransferase involved in cell wall biosynthesis